MSSTSVGVLQAVSMCAVAVLAPTGEASPQSEYVVDGSFLAQPLHSIGAQSTAGTARLLMDYVEPQRSEILDLLFKPNYGAAFQHLKVEIGGDAQISCGSEPSSMRTANASAANFNRGYEHWLMSEARKRNPDIVLLGLVYAFPGWINPNGRTPYASPATEQHAATYVSDWVTGVKKSHNLTIDWVGLWNEQTFTTSYVKTLRATLDASGHAGTGIVGSDKAWEPIASDYLEDPGVRSAIGALTQHYPHCDARPGPGKGTGQRCGASIQNALQAHRKYGVKLFSSEDYSCWTDGAGAGVWASEVNSQYIGGNITMVSAWHLVSAFYPTVAFWNEGMISATQPWSGHFVASPTVWASAHTTQFTRAGKSHYLLQGKGAGELVDGGTYVSFWDPERRDLTIVIESAGPAVGAFCSGNCNGACNYGAATALQVATFAISNLDLHPTTTMALWRTRLGSVNVTGDGLFQQLADVAVINGRVSVEIERDAVYTISSVRTASKAGGRIPVIPPSAPFPLPYLDEFESTAPPSPGRYWSDMEGSFEVAPSKAPHGSASGRTNHVFKQATAERACCNFIPALDGPLPLTIIGSSSWEDVEASISFYVPGGWALFGVRSKFAAGSFFRGGLGKPTGIFIGIDQQGYQLLAGLESASAGLKWPCSADCFASGHFTGEARWRRATLSVSNRTLTYNVGEPLAQTLHLPDGVGTGSGFAAIATAPGVAGTEIEFDNFTIKAASALTPASRCQSTPQAGDRVVTVGCGDPTADAGAKWQIHPADANGTRLISLRSDPGLCLSYDNDETDAEVEMPSQGLRWNTTEAGHGATVVVRGDGAWAEWRTRPGEHGCDAIALGAAQSPSTTAFWVLLKALEMNAPGPALQRGAAFIDIGWCSPGIDLSGSTWMGWQRGNAWVYRGSNGNFMAANGSHSQGIPYGTAFGPGSNVTAVRHSNTSLEFFVDGRSNGRIALPAAEAVPEDAVPCAGACDSIAMGLVADAPPRRAAVTVARCNASTQAQRWTFDEPFVGVQHWSGGGLVMGGGAAGDFVPARVENTGTQLWWSSDEDMGFIHSRSNAPMTCNCLGVCGK